MSNRKPLLQSQYDKYQQELTKLLTEDIPKNSSDLAAATAQGDLSENAEYDAAKDEQAKLHARVNELRDILDNAIIIERNENNDIVGINHTVTFESLDNGDQETVTIIGFGYGENMSSIETPLGKAILGKKVGEEFTVDAPIGELHYRLLSIESN